MNRIIHKFKQIKITQKITLTVFFFALAPIIILFYVITHNMRQSAINDQVFMVKTTMEQDYAQLQKTIDLCNMSTQVFLNNTSLINYLERIKSGEDIAVTDKIDFYCGEILSMERLVNSNPYLYQIRVYADSDTVQEMMPILYRKTRMERLEWGKGDIESGMWQFNYIDKIFSNNINSYIPAKHVMSLVTEIANNIDDNLGIIEVAVRMDDVFPGLFETNTARWTCFIDSENNKYYDESKDNKWNPHMEQIFKLIDIASDSEQYQVTKIGDEDVLIAYKPVEELKGRLIQVISLKDVMYKTRRLRTIYVFYLILIMGVLILAIYIIVKAMSKRFFLVFQALHEVQKGKLDVEIPVSGTDEIGELAEQINIMLKKIKQLMENNIKREVLVKNSEIRALQNQINSHFIYNVLESVKMMAEVDEQYDISDAITSLGKLLRYNMKGLSRNVSVKEEIDYIKNYVALMNLRFDYEIYLSLNIPDSLWNQQISKMSLQPIVENAICHGIGDIAEDTNIYIKGIVEEDCFFIEVSDQGKGISEGELEKLCRNIEGEVEPSGGSGSGIGLKNVQDRIKMNFGEDYGILISSKLGCYTKVSVKLPRNNKKLE